MTSSEHPGPDQPAHRGPAAASGTGDGAGILIQILTSFARECESGLLLPEPGKYALGVTFLPVEKNPRLQAERR